MNKKILWIFLDDDKKEDYFHFDNLEKLQKECNDFYVLQSIFFLKENIFDEVIIFKFCKRHEDICENTFNVNEGLLRFSFVQDYRDCLQKERPSITLFKGYHPFYKILSNDHSDFLGFKIVLTRLDHLKNIKYDRILYESDFDNEDRDNSYKQYLPFYRTCNQEIFKPTRNEVKFKYDICWICNFEKSKETGTEYFISLINRVDIFKNSKIINIGKNQIEGFSLAKKYNVKNINFFGPRKNEEINNILNESKYGLISSSRFDYSPKYIFEILSVQIPLLIREEAKLLNFYNNKMICKFKESKINNVLSKFNREYENNLQEGEFIRRRLSIERIATMNYETWKKFI